MLRYLAIIALMIAGIIRSPFLAVELTDVPAHELFYVALGAAQIMWALYFLWQPLRWLIWLGLMLSGGSLSVLLFASVLGVPFTGNTLTLAGPLGVALAAELVGFFALLAYLAGRHQSLWRAGLPAICLSLIFGGGIWGAATATEPHLPDLAHTTIDQFEVFDQIDALNATDYDWNLPAGFPVPPVPEDNPMTEAKVELGRYLFYDVRLSGNGTMACASCHHQEQAFTDGLAVPVGSTGEPHIRNSQTLVNVAYNSTYTWGNPVLTEIEQQVVIPLFGEFPVEMGVTGNEAIVMERLEGEPLYQQLFAAAFPEAETPITFDHTVKALSSFVRAMISGDAPYDRYVYQGDRTAMSDSALRGMNLFLSEKFECHHCHGGFNFTLSTRHAASTFREEPFFNTGLYNIDGEGAYPRGNRGVFDITGEPEDMGRFRPPTLRNIELTAPYMHDGSIETLDGVLDFYADGGRVIQDGPHAGDGRENPFKSGFVPGFEITAQEREDLLNFLKTLTDETFLEDPRFSDPFEDSPERVAGG